MKKLSALHRFIIRNCDLLSVSEMAGFLDVPAAAVEGWISSLGLPEMELIERDRAFPILLRRNHDLLSDEEIARLLEMPVDACRTMAQEMDFLDIKLGPKPDSLPQLHPHDPGPEADTLAFRDCCERYLADYSEWEKPFAFLHSLRRKEAPGLSETDGRAESAFEIRMMYSYTGTHGDFLLAGEDFYSEGILSRLQNRGINAGWMPALLRDLAPSSVFEEFGVQHEVRLENLRKQVEKAARYGISIFLYFNEPRFTHEDFFRKYPGSRGMAASQPGYYGMCTSDERVRDWLGEAAEFVLRSVPGIGGIILITASENETNCYSRRPRPEKFDHLALESPSASMEMCPRCMARGPQHVLTDTATLMSQSAEASGSGAELIQWLWGWDLIMPLHTVKDATVNLPSRVAVMVDWAKYTPFTVFGKEASIGEYTLAHVEPSEFAREILETSREQGRRTLAKVALVSTVEMNALPYLPVMHNVERLLKALEGKGVDGFLGCWIFGAYPGRSMEMVAYGSHQQPSESLALKYYGRGAEDALEAWRLFSEGMRFYPSVVSVLYLSAINPGPGLKFSLEPEPWRYGMVAMATERISEISEPFGPEVMARGFREVAQYFAEGLEHLREAIKRSDRHEWHEENLRDYGICEACMRHLLSGANYTDFILTRDRWLNDRTDSRLLSELVTILKDELANSEAMLDLAKKDSRIGYEGSIGYFYTPIEMVEKIYEILSGIEYLEES